jgi:threonine synthase
VDSHGAVDIVTDAEILEAQTWLATNGGIFVEPASAAPIAGLMKCCDPARSPAFSFEKISERSKIVCTVTGHGLKDPDIISARIATVKAIPAKAEAVLSAIGF